MKKVLICPLDWGLGHATRCIPVIRELERQGCEVVIAGSGESLALLKLEFPSCRFFELPSYDIKYPGTIPFVVHFGLRAPKLIAIVKKENQAVSNISKTEKVDFIISDNRYGCYHKNIPSAIIIHQLSLTAPPFTFLVNHYNESFIKKFNECWVPDTADHRLSGRLSINKRIAHKFIGPLSRMRRNGTSLPTLQLLGLISGPEPARTKFDELLADQLTQTGFSYKIVRGLPTSNIADNTSYPHLPSLQLNELIESAGVVISRSGYSTIMDLAALKKKAIFVPTPGQTEQLYLAKEMQRKKIAPMMLQDGMSLPSALKRLDGFTGFTEDYFNKNLLEATVREFLG